MAKARKAGATQSKLMTLLYGMQGTGKSTMAMQLAYFHNPDGSPFKILYLDAEGGSIDDYLTELEQNGVDLDNIYIVYTQSLGEVKEYINKVRDGEDFYVLDDDGNETTEVVLDADGKPFRADAIVVDGTTILNMTVQQGLISFSQKRNAVKANKQGLIGDERLVKVEGAGLEIKDWSTINYKGQSFVLDLLASGVHCVITARETDEKVSIKDADGKITSVATGKKIASGFKDMGFNCKTEIRLYKEDGDDETVYAKVIKDRTKVHKHGEVIEDPSMLDWQVVIDKTAKNKSFTLGNTLAEAVVTEQNIYEKETINKIDGQMANHSSTNDTESRSVDEVRKEIMAELKKVTDPTKKKEIKTKLSENQLPTQFKQVTNVELLEKTLSFIKENI